MLSKMTGYISPPQSIFCMPGKLYIAIFCKWEPDLLFQCCEKQFLFLLIYYIGVCVLVAAVTKGF